MNKTGSLVFEVCSLDQTGSLSRSRSNRCRSFQTQRTGSRRKRRVFALHQSVLDSFRHRTFPPVSSSALFSFWFCLALTPCEHQRRDNHDRRRTALTFLHKAARRAVKTTWAEHWPYGGPLTESSLASAPLKSHEALKEKTC